MSIQNIAYLKAHLQSLFDAGRFSDADTLFNSQTVIDSEEYHDLKAYDGIQPWLTIQQGFELDDEKARILSHTSRNILVKARAGSGKTRFLSLKTLLATQTEGIESDEILILAFNRKAKDEILDRIRKHTPTFETARTFHSLAYAIVLPKGEILQDDEDSNSSNQERSKFIQNLLKQVLSEELLSQFYELYRRTDHDEKDHKKVEDNYDNRRSQDRPYVTLNGEKVKSRAEKYIADFLFERGIQYKYERPSGFLNGVPYRPDYTLWANEFDVEAESNNIFNPDETPTRSGSPTHIWEHWGYTSPEYLKAQADKRNYWLKKQVPLIETYNDDLYQAEKTRESFELFLEDRLNQLGISTKKEPIEKLYAKFRSRQNDSLVKLLTSFITRAKQKMLSPSKLNQLREQYIEKSEREKQFLTIACRLYNRYEENLIESNVTDFEGILKQAIDRIHTNNGQIILKAGSRSVNLCTLKYLLIDEYQDFSPLFHGLIEAIRCYNPTLKLLCVGDDWQAIYGFAGADLSLFDGFQDMFSNACILPLSTNYRSSHQVVKVSNQLMSNNGIPANAQKHSKPGWVCSISSFGTPIELRKEPEYEEALLADEMFFPAFKGYLQKFNQGLVNARLMKTIYKLILNHPGQDIVLLSRTNKICQENAEEWLKRLKNNIFKNNGKHCYPKKLEISTIHRYKGREADIVIILEVNDGQFPLLHSDSDLLRMLGLTEEQEYAEERRLFYVGLTRAKEGVYLLSDAGSPSTYLKDLTLNPMPNFPKMNMPFRHINVQSSE